MELYEDISRWVLSPPTRPPDEPITQNPNIAFAHIEGPPATGKGFYVPENIWNKLSSQGRGDISVVHVVPNFKMPLLSNDRRGVHVKESSEKGLIPVMTMDYRGLLRKLKQSRQGESWKVEPKGPLAPKTLFILQVDLDFSADFFLAFHAVIAFSLSLSQDDPKTMIRVATMSSEPADDLYSRLLPGEAEITAFELPPEEKNFQTVVLEEGQEAFEMIAELQESLTDGPHTIIWLNDRFQPFPRWKDDDWEGRGWSEELFELDATTQLAPARPEDGNHILFHVLHGTRVPDMLAVPGYTHIIPSKTRRRLIFDLETRQVANVDLFITESEKRYQMSWTSRVHGDLSKMYFYADKEYMEGEASHPRRKDILNSQLAGYIAGLAQFEDWPSGMRSFEGLLKLFTHQHESTKGVVKQTLRRLELQGLLQVKMTNTGRLISLKDGVQKAFFDVLPLVKYDTRLAYLLAQPSDSRITSLKIQVAALLNIGHEGFVSIDLQRATFDDIKRVRGLAMTGYGASITMYGSLWAALGLVKRRYMEMTKKATSTSFSTGLVIVDQVDLHEWVRQCQEIQMALSLREPVVDILHEIGTITDDEFETLCWHLLKAFSFQIGVLSWTDDKGPVVYDFVSKVQLRLGDPAAIMIDFKAIKEKDPDCIVGFYATPSRSPDNSMLVIDEWNWIPSNLWRRWAWHLHADGCTTLADLMNSYGRGANIDEK